MTIKHNYLIIIYAIALHLVWAFALLLDPAAGNATAVHTLLNYVSHWSAIGIYLAAAMLALLGLFDANRIIKTLCLLPQQFVMMVSAGGALWAMWLGQFADGVQRSQAFLIADQSPAVIAAILHTIAIVYIIKEAQRVS